MKKPRELHNFYKSAEWQIVRQQKITEAHGLCERCGGVGVEVHHIKHLTVANVNDPKITLNKDNLIYLCRECHNKEHQRFTKPKPRFDEDGNILPPS